MAAGLGLDYGIVRLGRTTDDWLLAGSWLRDQVEGLLGPLVKGIEQVGSSSVPTLLAKPIADWLLGCPGIRTSPPSSTAWTPTGGPTAATQVRTEDMSSCSRRDRGTESLTFMPLNTTGWSGGATYAFETCFAAAQWLGIGTRP